MTEKYDELPGISLNAMISLNFMLILEFILQTLVFYSANHKEIITPVILAAAGSSAALAIYTVVAYRYQADIRNHILACIFVLFLGPAGCLVSMICCTFNYIFSRNRKKNFSEWLFQYLYSGNEHETRSDKLYQRIVAGQEALADNVDTEPLADIMESGTVEQKQQALIKAVKYFSPAMVPVLKAGLNDSNNLIRVQAAGGIARLQDDFHKKYVTSEKKLQEENGDSEDLIRFAGICEEYAQSGLLDSEKKAAAIKNSIAIYERFSSANSGDMRINISLIKMLMIDKNHKRAMEILDRITPHLSNPPLPVKSTVMELLFETGNYEKMRNFAADWDMNKKSDDPEDETLILWSSNGYCEETEAWKNT